MKKFMWYAYLLFNVIFFILLVTTSKNSEDIIMSLQIIGVFNSPIFVIWLFRYLLNKRRASVDKLHANLLKMEELTKGKETFQLNEKYFLAFDNENKTFEALLLPDSMKKMQNVTFDLIPLKEIDFSKNKEIYHTQVNNKARLKTREIERFYITMIFKNNSKIKIELENVSHDWTSIEKRAIKFEEFYMKNMAKVEN